jgi:hypothetical protein
VAKKSERPEFLAFYRPKKITPLSSLLKPSGSLKKITAARAADLLTLYFVGNFYQNSYPNQGI